MAQVNRTKSLLVYPGGKAMAAEQLANTIPVGTSRVISPFFGGGSVEISLASRGIEVLGFDLFPPLVNFWQVALAQPEELAVAIYKHHPITEKVQFIALQESYDSLESPLEQAAAYFALNRSAMSGMTFKGAFAKNHKSFSTASIERVRKFSCPKLYVDESDFQMTLDNYPDDFLYLDPPYDIKSDIYGAAKDKSNTQFPHKRLAEMLVDRPRWILSYSDTPLVRELYAECPHVLVDWHHGMSGHHYAEVLILSKDFTESVYMGLGGLVAVAGKYGEFGSFDKATSRMLRR